MNTQIADAEAAVAAAQANLATLVKNPPRAVGPNATPEQIAAAAEADRVYAAKLADAQDRLQRAQNALTVATDLWDVPTVKAATARLTAEIVKMEQTSADPAKAAQLRNDLVDATSRLAVLTYEDEQAALAAAPKAKAVGPARVSFSRVSFTGNRTSGSPDLTSVTAAAGVSLGDYIGAAVAGSGIPSGVTIVGFDSVARVVTLSDNATSGDNASTSVAVTRAA